MNKKREVVFFKSYFREFYAAQTPKVKQKVLWTLKVVEELDQIPELTGTDGLYEIRVQAGNDISRIFCFFDQGNVVVFVYYHNSGTEEVLATSFAELLVSRRGRRPRAQRGCSGPTGSSCATLRPTNPPSGWPRWWK